MKKLAIKPTNKLALTGWRPILIRWWIIQDLVQIIEKVGYKTDQQIGTNWLAPNLNSVVDKLLRLKPTFCSTIIVVGVKPVN
ncbi:hypothetical protein PN36_17435 [Candidatus Thiomargarita nelsonii]|uniref:Uncharacterized protein n=1 Tax=Candidatus Thiomargarita nelsonii TaxID=1003181 RepID=A0A4E0QPK3_9GAMM|nr:hypothetical protein PN36_17435 [Candidatus Thiomargarita nelsonii]